MKTEKWQSSDGRVTLYLGDSLYALQEIESETIDAIVTDPPYSSGGQFRGDRTASTVSKYVQSSASTSQTRAEFSGDNRDQRSFLAWCSLWMAGAFHAARPGAVFCSFIDWRQIPILTDAIQAGGWTWRNLCTWWKPGCRMQKGRFSSSAEYLVYATKGAHSGDGESSPQNVIQCQTLSGEKKVHIAEKPEPVVSWALSATRPLGVVLDPFMGSGSTGVVALLTGRSFVGIEIDRHHFELAKKRIMAAHNNRMRTSLMDLIQPTEPACSPA